MRHVKKAIEDAKARGIIGESVMGSSHRLELSVVRGRRRVRMRRVHGVDGINRRTGGEPRAKYIRSVQRGLWNQPTVLNNVETLANIPVIIKKGGEAFADIGTEGSSGTKVFALVGKVKGPDLWKCQWARPCAT